MMNSSLRVVLQACKSQKQSNQGGGTAAAIGEVCSFIVSVAVAVSHNGLQGE